jgi:uncharacterized membrane protein YeaQ/YmgE (transglycosylase-associated protein family)
MRFLAKSLLLSESFLITERYDYLMNLFTWIVFGLIVGIIAELVDHQPARGGLFGAVLLGIVGAVVGGFMANTLFGLSVSGFDFTSLAIATVGSLLVLSLGRAWRNA